MEEENSKPNMNSFFIANSLDYPIQKKSNKTQIDIQEYFSLLFKNQPLEINKSNLYDGFVSFISNLQSKLQKKNLKKANEILIDLISNLRYEQFEENKMLIRYGDNVNIVPVILTGTIDLIVPLEIKTLLYETEYMRYLALLIEYEEYELVNRVLSGNINDYYLEILNTNGYGMVAHNIKTGYGASKYVTLDKLKDYLSKEEREFCQKQAKMSNVTRSNYLSMVNYANDRILNNSSQEKRIEVKLLKYKHITTLHPGEFLGDYQSHSNKNINKYEATFITSSNVSIGYLSVDVYFNTIKSIIEETKKKEIDFLMSYTLFKDIPSDIFSNKYFYLFKYFKSDLGKRNEETNSSIKLIKKGGYDLITKQSLSELPNSINNLHQKLSELQYNSTSDNAKEHWELKEIINELNAQNEALSEKIEDRIINQPIYFERKEIKLFTIEPKELIGFDIFNLSTTKDVFRLSISNKLTEYYSLDKGIYNKIRLNEESVVKAEKDYLIRKIKLIINRLLEIYKGKSQIILINHENDKRDNKDNPVNEMMKVKKELFNHNVVTKNEKVIKKIWNKEALQSYFMKTNIKKTLSLHNNSKNQTKFTLNNRKTIKNSQYSIITTSKDISDSSFVNGIKSQQYPQLQLELPIRQQIMNLSTSKPPHYYGSSFSTCKSGSLNITLFNDLNTSKKSLLYNNHNSEMKNQYINDKYLPLINSLNRSNSMMLGENNSKNTINNERLVCPGLSTMKQSYSILLKCKNNLKKRGMPYHNKSLFASLGCTLLP